MFLISFHYIKGWIGGIEPSLSEPQSDVLTVILYPPQRRGWDSNPRAAHHGLEFSRLPHSTRLCYPAITIGRGFEPPDRVTSVNRLAIYRIKPTLPPHQKDYKKQQQEKQTIRLRCKRIYYVYSFVSNTFQIYQKKMASSSRTYQPHRKEKRNTKQMYGSLIGVLLIAGLGFEPRTSSL